MRKIGDAVFVVADNYGSPATIIDTRDDDGKTAPVSHYKVRTDTGDEFWAMDFEISDAEQVKRVHTLFMQKLADEYPDHPWLKKEKAMQYDSTQDTREHIEKVRNRLQECIGNLTVRAHKHDASKLQEPEKSAYDNLMRFKSSHDMVYGSPDYAEGLKILGPALDHHYAANDHHPQHTPAGVAGMSLLSLLEMLCDWKAAGERYKDGSITQSLAHNRERFGIDDQLFAILENTVKEMDW
jgi:hypothetical protein